MVSIRPAQPADAPAIAEVHVDTFRHTYRGIISDAFLDTMSCKQSTDRILRRLRSGACCFVAEDADGKIVGFADGGRERDGDPEYAGEMYSLYVRPAWHGRGVGKALVEATVSELCASGRCPIIVWVLEANTNARRFYEHLGGQAVRSGMWTVGDQSVPEIGYALPRQLFQRETI
jgi:ribosomal protein S18 acetylase RimI-like enzyme